jgi:hypothetical protein
MADMAVSQGWGLRARLAMLVNVFDNMSDVEDRFVRTVNAVWSYIIDTSLWQESFQTLDEFKYTVDYQHKVLPSIVRHGEITRRAALLCNDITSTWGINPMTDWPDDIQPQVVSHHMARELRLISQLAEYSVVLPRIRNQIAKRRSTVLRTRKTPRILHSDLQHVRADLELELVKESPPNGPGQSNHVSVIIHNNISSEFSASTAGVPPSKSNEAQQDEEVDKSSEYNDEQQDEEMPDTPGSPPPSKTCSCPEDMLKVLQSLKGPRASEEGSTFFVTVMESGIVRDICHRHLRSLCSQAVGLQSNNSHAVLLKRLEETYPHVNNLDPFTIDHPDWFYKDVRVITEEESRLRVFKFPGEPDDDMVVDDAISEMILTRYGGPDTVNVWYDVGTIIVGDVFQYINTLELNALVDIEFNIYRHHHRMLPGKKRLGWLRNMFFSIIQQLVRQDLVWYALSVACRPDHNHRLITYPYVTKDTDPGKRTYFFHMDLNVERYCKDGHGGNLLTSSVSLDDEDEQSCTFIMPGFHKHIHDWHRKRTAAGTSTNGYTTGLANAFTAEELKEWPLRPCPCPAYGIRISNAQTPHGSHGPTELPADSTEEPTDHRRRTCSAWHSAFDKEHQKLDIDDTLSHPDLTRCHLYLEVPSREPSGQTPKYGAPDYRFPASVVLGSISPIGDALVGRRKYTDPEVQRDLKILFGSDREAAAKLVKQHQDEAVRQYFVAYKKMEALEREIFGENSYFHWRDQGNLGIPEAE